MFLHDNIVCGRQYDSPENENSQNSVLLITLYADYSNRTGLSSDAYSNIHGFGKWDNRIRSPISRGVGSGFKLNTYFASQCNVFLTESN